MIIIEVTLNLFVGEWHYLAFYLICACVHTYIVLLHAISSVYFLGSTVVAELLEGLSKEFKIRSESMEQFLSTGTIQI